jgi:hypothetical protein
MQRCGGAAYDDLRSIRSVIYPLVRLEHGLLGSTTQPDLIIYFHVIYNTINMPLTR